MVTTFVNGKFTAQSITGVQRYAHELVVALDALLETQDAGGRFVLLCPRGAQPPQLRNIAVQITGGPRMPLHLWEQMVLPLAARRGRLLNLAGSAPVMAGQQACTLHDAAVFDRPEAYSPAFVIWYRFLFARLGRRAGWLITVSQFSRHRLALALGQPEARWHVVPGAPDHLEAVTARHDVLARLSLQPGQFLLAVASSNPNKNLPRLVQAFASLDPRPGLALVLVGGRNTRVFADTSPNADPLGVVRAGVLDDGELKALYQAARALVFPSLYEGFGLPPLEAMRCGCPAGVSAEGALPEVCGEAAFVLDAHDTARLASGLRRLLDDDDLCTRLRHLGLERTRPLDWKASARALLQALHSSPLKACR